MGFDGAPRSERRLRGSGRRGMVLSRVGAVVIAVLLKTLVWTVLCAGESTDAAPQKKLFLAGRKCGNFVGRRVLVAVEMAGVLAVYLKLHRDNNNCRWNSGTNQPPTQLIATTTHPYLPSRASLHHPLLSLSRHLFRKKTKAGQLHHDGKYKLHVKYSTFACYPTLHNGSPTIHIGIWSN